ncbi:MAG: serine protein kinase PrkA [Deltaproteobacteria bacterium]|nr:serine protein kinase PrkA [Deltaproteobacteria bacterium]
MDAGHFLEEVATAVTRRFEEGRSLLSFDAYLEGYLRSPAAWARSAPQMLLGAFEHFGSEERRVPTGAFRRHRLFDAPFADGRGAVAGQDAVARRLLRILENFARQGRVDRLIVLHGPNGSAKSSIVAVMMDALEAYSRTQEGAAYRFGWVFPKTEFVKGPVGFGGFGGGSGPVVSFAHLEAGEIDARLGCEMKDHPLLLVPVADRQRLLAVAREADPSFVPSAHLAHGGPCRKCRTIFDALMNAYRGNYARVMAHVQVERFTYSRRYVEGAVTVEPQMSVDAALRALALDRSASSLPPALQTVNILEAAGPLVSGNRGIIEYADLLKRPLEAFKYLLGTSETGEVRMEHLVLQLDAVLIASTNEAHLGAFKEIPDFGSFKGRMELVRVPYLRRLSDERAIYERRVAEAAAGKHVAPHALQTAVRWAILGRLWQPEPEAFPEAVRPLVAALTPVEKMELYEHGEPPERLSLEEQKMLAALVPALFGESEGAPVYEGRFGPSPREVGGALMNAAQDPGHLCLEVPAVLEQIEEILQDKSVYAFLQMEPRGGYHDHAAFLEQVRELWLDAVDEEVREALGFVAEAQFRESFERYIVTLSAWVKGETQHNKVTGKDEPPDERMMQELEGIFAAKDEDRERFRKDLIGRVGAYRLEHPGEDGPLDYPKIFPVLYRRLRDHHHAARRGQLVKVHDHFLQYLDEEGRAALEPEARKDVERLLSGLTERHGYCEHCAHGAVLALMRARYAD